jgi:hypothetical protein
MPELPTKRRHAEVSVHSLAALVSSADKILVSKLKTGLHCGCSLHPQIGAAYANEGKMPFLFSLTCDGVNK